MEWAPGRSGGHSRPNLLLCPYRSLCLVVDTLGGVTLLFVNTAQGQVGRDVAALVGGTLLNLVDGVIRSQEALPAAERKRVTVVVDEMQAIPGADYEAMLSELGKFGASFVMATQSLTRLEDLSRTLRETLFSNIGCLVAFQTSASDARYLTWELDRDQVTEEDLTSLPVHHCYVLHFFLELERRAEWRGRVPGEAPALSALLRQRPAVGDVRGVARRAVRIPGRDRRGGVPAGERRRGGTLRHGRGAASIHDHGGSRGETRPAGHDMASRAGGTACNTVGARTRTSGDRGLLGFQVRTVELIPEHLARLDALLYPIVPTQAGYGRP